MLKGEVKNIRGVQCELIAPDIWCWRTTSGTVWTYSLWGHRLRMGEEVVAEGKASLDYYVIYSTGYEQGVAGLIRKVRQWCAMQRSKGVERPDIMELVDKIRRGL